MSVNLPVRASPSPFRFNFCDTQQTTVTCRDHGIHMQLQAFFNMKPSQKYITIIDDLQSKGVPVSRMVEIYFYLVQVTKSLTHLHMLWQLRGHLFLWLCYPRLWPTEPTAFFDRYEATFIYQLGNPCWFRSRTGTFDPSSNLSWGKFVNWSGDLES